LQNDKKARRRCEAMAVRIIIDRKVKKGKEADFAKLLRKLRSKAIFSEGYISGEMLRDREDPQNYLVITAWQSVSDWEKYEKIPETNKIHAKIEKLMARPTKVKICMHA
jgi:heme-degrading monooxygenase HmoA